MVMKNGIAFTSGCFVFAAFTGLCAVSLSAQQGPPGGGKRGPTDEMLKACEGKAQGDSCSASFPQRTETNGTCFAPQDRPLACRPSRGAAAPDGRQARSAMGKPIESTRAMTLGVLCSLESDTLNSQLGLKSQAQWSCSNGSRLLTASGTPDHPTGKFPNSSNPNSISEQTITYATTLTPVARSGPGQQIKVPAYALNGVKFDPGTAGRCETGATDPSFCDLGRGTGQWHIEALGQSSFDFGDDNNHAHVQPTGEYHYHGIPEAMLSAQNKSGQAMQLVGWAADGFPLYARYGYDNPKFSTSSLRVMKSSYRLKIVPDADRPSITAFPLGSFTQDFEFVPGFGDLDECNGRFAVTPEFPEGIYHYYATDSFPFIQRCVKGSPFSLSSERPRATERGQRRRGEGRRGRRPPPNGERR